MPTDKAYEERIRRMAARRGLVLRKGLALRKPRTRTAGALDHDRYWLVDANGNITVSHSDGADLETLEAWLREDK
jgi:hypothetical protein